MVPKNDDSFPLDTGAREEISTPMATITVVPEICSAGSANEAWRTISSATVSFGRHAEKALTVSCSMFF